MTESTKQELKKTRSHRYKDFDEDKSPEALTLRSMNPEDAAHTARIVFDLPLYEYEDFKKSSLMREIVKYFDLIEKNINSEVQLVCYRLW